ncbi:hypothetical protein LS73_009430, partial [Helicobacter muridarum]
DSQGYLLLGNHRAKALQNLSPNARSKYKQAIKDKFNVDLANDELFVRRIDDSIPLETRILIAKASNDGLENSLSELTFTKLAKYYDALQSLPKRIGDDTSDLEYLYRKTNQLLGGQPLKESETNLALLSSLMQDKSKFVSNIDTLASKPNDMAITDMLIKNAASFYNIKNAYPDIPIDSMLQDAITFLVNAPTNTKKNYEAFVESLEHYILNPNKQAQKALGATPLTFKSQGLGIVLTRIANTNTNPAQSLFTYLKRFEEVAKELQEPNFFSAVRNPNEYDFLKVLIGNANEANLNKIRLYLDKLQEYESSLPKQGNMHEASTTRQTEATNINPNSHETRIYDNSTTREIQTEPTTATTDNIQPSLEYREQPQVAFSQEQKANTDRKQMGSTPSINSHAASSNARDSKDKQGHNASIGFREDSLERPQSIGNLHEPKASNRISNNHDIDSQIPKDIQQAWLKTFNLKSIQEDFIPNIKPEIIQALGNQNIHVKSGSLIKLNVRGRIDFLQYIKPTLENPDVVMKHQEAYLFIKDIGNEKSMFVSVVKNENNELQNNELIVSSNALRTLNNLKNKMNLGNAEILYKSKEASNILAEAFNLKTFSKELTQSNSTKNKTEIKEAKQNLKAITKQTKSKASLDVIPQGQNGVSLEKEFISTSNVAGILNPTQKAIIKQQDKSERAAIEKALNLEPIDEFGINYAEYYRDGKGAIQKLLKEKQGQVTGAFYKEGLGDIDLVWGNKNIGLQKILEKHINDFKSFVGDSAEQKLINGIDEIVQNGKVVSNAGVNTIIHNKDNREYRVGLSKGFHSNGENNWVITAYKRENPHAQNFDQVTNSKELENGYNLSLKDSPNSTTKKLNKDVSLDAELESHKTDRIIKGKSVKDLIAESKKSTIIPKEVEREAEKYARNTLANSKDPLTPNDPFYDKYFQAEKQAYIRENYLKEAEKYVLPDNAHTLIKTDKGIYIPYDKEGKYIKSIAMQKIENQEARGLKTPEVEFENIKINDDLAIKEGKLYYKGIELQGQSGHTYIDTLNMLKFLAEPINKKEFLDNAKAFSKQNSSSFMFESPSELLFASLSIPKQNYKYHQMIDVLFAKFDLKTNSFEESFKGIDTIYKQSGEPFGYIWEGQGRGKEAIEFLLDKKLGQIQRAFYKEGLGDIDLVWGDSKMGLQHIIERRSQQWGEEKALRFIKEDLPQIVENSKLYKQDNNKIELITDKDILILGRKDNNKFIVTSFKDRRSKSRYKELDNSQTLDEANFTSKSVSEQLKTDDILLQNHNNSTTKAITFDMKDIKLDSIKDFNTWIDMLGIKFANKQEAKEAYQYALDNIEKIYC